MRAVGLSDLDIAARVIMTVPQEAQMARAAALIEAAHQADKIRKRTGRPAPDGGTGSLYVQASLAGPLPRQDAANPAYCAALRVVLTALAVYRTRHSEP